MKKRRWITGDRLHAAGSRQQVAGCRFTAYALSFFVSCVLFNTAFAQTVSSSITKEKIVIGEQTVMEIKIDGITAGSIQADFNFPDTVNHLEILSHTREELSKNSIIYQLKITSFDSGYWELPRFEMKLTDQRSIMTEPIGIAVVTVDVSDLADYHDIKDIIDVKPGNNWWIISVIVALALISLFGFLWFMNRRKIIAPIQILPVTNLQQLHNDFIRRMRELSAADMLDRQQVTAVFDEASQRIRSFADAAWRQDNRHLTTGEYMLRVKGKIEDAEIESRYFQFLRLADAVKFAKYLPPAEETKAMFPLLENISTRLLQQSKSQR